MWVFIIKNKIKSILNNMGLLKYLKIKKQERFRKKHKIGLCLSGGGVRGFSFVGAFKAFEEYGIKFDAVAGTSAGSLFGALYAANLSYKDMYKYVTNAKNTDFRKAKLGFLPSKMDTMHEKLSQILPVKKVEDLSIPYYAVAVDLKTGNEIHFHGGDLATIITGSCAIPGVFYPVKYKGMNLIDGGVSNNVPVDILKEHGCDLVVTIDCNCTRGGGTNSESLITQFITSIGIMMVNNSKKGLRLSDLTICPNLKRFSSLNVKGKEDIIQEGYIATIDMMPEILNLMNGNFKKK